MKTRTRTHMERCDVPSAIEHLRAGGLLIYPTETAYAVGCDATNAKAVRAIFRLKEREHGKPLPLIVASRAMAEQYVRFTPLARRLAKKYWPGPLTVVLNRRGGATSPPAGDHVGSPLRLAPGILAPDGSTALRVSANPIVRALSRMLGRPIVSTSANRSGQPLCYSVRSVLRSLGMTRKIRSYFSGHSAGVAVLDVGPLPRRRPSTIADARGSLPIILRQGSIHVV